MGQSLMGDGGRSSQSSTPRFVAAVDARSQLVALATSSHARCGAHSPARTLWLPGSPFLSPTRSFLHSFLDAASFALVLNEADNTYRHPETVLSFSLSRALLGPVSEVAGPGGGRGYQSVTTRHYSRLDLATFRSPCATTHLLVFDAATKKYSVAPLGVPGPVRGRFIGFSDEGVEEESFCTVAVSKWMDWAVAADLRTKASLVIVRLGDGCTGTAASRRVRVPLDPCFTLSALVFPSCFKDELVLIGYQASEGRKELLGMAFVVVDLQRSFQTESMCVATSAIVTDQETNYTFNRERAWPPLLLKKRDGSAAFILSLPLSDLVQVDSPTGQITHMRCTVMTASALSVTQLSQSVFCAHCMPDHPNSLCELWDCNNTTRPLKTVSVPGCRQAIASSGFLFIVTADHIQVLEPLSGFVVLTITFPPKRLLGIARESVL